ncbi:hypothetical protein B0H14DRAFT_3881663 [Mycena olivaceomarginata]|nr:hypothetical protein B0H14DRAFT_3881663 [Mycena olivaceomarginata]
MQYWCSCAHAASVHRKSRCAPPASYPAPAANDILQLRRLLGLSAQSHHLPEKSAYTPSTLLPLSLVRRAAPPAGPAHTAIVHSRPPCLASPCATALLSAAPPPGRSSHRPLLLCRARASRYDPIAQHHPHARHAHLALITAGAAHAQPSTCPIRDTTPLCSITCMPSMRTGGSPSPAPRPPTPVACIVTAFTSTRLTAAPIAHQRPLPHFDPGLSIIACAALVHSHRARRGENAAAGGQRATQPHDRHTGRVEPARST